MATWMAWLCIKGRKDHLIYSSFLLRDNHDAFYGYVAITELHGLARIICSILYPSPLHSDSTMFSDDCRYWTKPSTCWRQRDLHVTMELHQKLRTFHMTECFLFSRSVKPSLASPHYTKLLEYHSISSGEIKRQDEKKGRRSGVKPRSPAGLNFSDDNTQRCCFLVELQGWRIKDKMQSMEREKSLWTSCSGMKWLLSFLVPAPMLHVDITHPVL